MKQMHSERQQQIIGTTVIYNVFSRIPVTFTLAVIQYGVALPWNECGQLNPIPSECKFQTGIQHFIVIVFCKRSGQVYYFDPTFSLFSVSTDEENPVVYADFNDLKI